MQLFYSVRLMELRAENLPHLLNLEVLAVLACLIPREAIGLLK